jgi:hypothetical protein
MPWWDEFKEGVQADYGIGRDDTSKAFYAQRGYQNLDDDAPRVVKMAAEHPLIFRLRELTGNADPSAIRARNEAGMGLKPTAAGKAGQLVGTIGADLTQDISRNWWWLFNAAQATGNVINESALGFVNRDLYGARDLNVPFNDLEELERQGYAAKDSSGTIRPNPKVFNAKGKAKERNYRSGMVASLGIPAGVAINNSLGLLTPFGGAEGYEALFPSEEDASKTNNVIAEVGAKYLLGRTGALLDYDEFKKVRPDVSKGEYKAYKAFKYDNNTDLNPFDGDLVLPAGVAKATTDGIHGAEVQFLGRSLPVNTGIIPFASAVAGGIAGVRRRKQFDSKGRIDPDSVKRGFVGGTAGAVGGMTLGNLLEAERRKRNEASNQAYYDKLDKLETT